VKVEGSTVLVTGASSGIGAALAEILAARGATVGLIARRGDRLDQVAERCRVHSPASRSWIADLADLARAEALALEAWDAFDGLDCLVNNAAIPKRTPADRLTAADVAHVMDVNFHAPVRMTLALLPRWLARDAGCVVNVASIGGRIPIAHEAAYCASKAALCAFTETMAVDLHESALEIKLVFPGAIATEIWDQPANDPSPYTGPFVPVDECAAALVDAMEGDGFEHYVPDALPGQGRQHDVVAMKTADTDAFITMMGAFEEQGRSDTS
jgi:short-subunit dehydrogenase